MLQRHTLDLMLVNLFQRCVLMIIKLIIRNNLFYFQPSCPNGLVRGQARKLETQSLLMMKKKVGLKLLLNHMKKKRKKRRRKKRKKKRRKKRRKKKRNKILLIYLQPNVHQRELFRF